MARVNFGCPICGPVSVDAHTATVHGPRAVTAALTTACPTCGEAVVKTVDDATSALLRRIGCRVATNQAPPMRCAGSITEAEIDRFVHALADL